jgi:hypothetical protein
VPSSCTHDRRRCPGLRQRSLRRFAGVGALLAAASFPPSLGLAILIMAISLGISPKSDPLHRHKPALCQRSNGRIDVARGHPEVAGSVNPEGCQRVAGGRRRVWGRRPPDSGAGDALHPGRGARLVTAEPARGCGLLRSCVRGLAPLRGARLSDAVFRWSFPPLP